MTPSWPSVQWFIVAQDRVVGVTMINLPIIQAVTGHAGQIGPKMRDVPWWGLRTCTLNVQPVLYTFPIQQIYIIQNIFLPNFSPYSSLSFPSVPGKSAGILSSSYKSAHRPAHIWYKAQPGHVSQCAQHTAESIKLGSKHNSSFFVCSASLNVAKTVGTWRNFVHLHVCAMKVLGTRNTSHSPSPPLWYSDF